ncbi:MAG: hypothetical protein IIC75_09200 [Bacteroidetes bacterium]|nr:hypothetical protein [Bacteroidota bacterium]
MEIKSPVRSTKRLSPSTEDLLINYDFPGNVRELDHIIERAIIFSSDDIIQPEDLSLPTNNKKIQGSNIGDDLTDILPMNEVEKIHLVKALDFFGWDRAKTSYKLGISIKTLYSKIKKYSLTQQ